jgi:uncharacterized protein (UPF0333 family)
MSLKKYLKRLVWKNKGQIFMEYVLLLVVIGGLTIAATSDFFKGFRDRISGFQSTAFSHMGSANALSNELENETE